MNILSRGKQIKNVGCYAIVIDIMHWGKIFEEMHE